MTAANAVIGFGGLCLLQYGEIRDIPERNLIVTEITSLSEGLLHIGFYIGVLVFFRIDGILAAFPKQDRKHVNTENHHQETYGNQNITKRCSGQNALFVDQEQIGKGSDQRKRTAKNPYVFHMADFHAQCI